MSATGSLGLIVGTFAVSAPTFFAMGAYGARAALTPLHKKNLIQARESVKEYVQAVEPEPLKRTELYTLAELKTAEKKGQREGYKEAREDLREETEIAVREQAETLISQGFEAGIKYAETGVMPKGTEW
jgi:hypothetical protein